MNKIERAYESIDRALMSGANAMIHAWNWTTGETKAQLANKTITISTVAAGTAYFVFSPICGFALTPIHILCSHILQRKNTEIEDRELKAIKSRCLDSHVVKCKDIYKSQAPFTVGGGTGVVGLGCYENEIRENLGYALIGASMILVGASEYMMRADNLPPRKNCVERGVDWLEEKVREYKAQPAVQPSFAYHQLTRF
ncbi:MAG: hypothetical protein KKD18_01125 [Nanoarchaeota archaeon]|nr:hypothetical protein [Nanoarchaeota archaeon]MBU0976997.1 hypothetical protein [Nanoarchaeota archaeon]